MRSSRGKEPYDWFGLGIRVVMTAAWVLFLVNVFFLGPPPADVSKSPTPPGGSAV